MSVFHFGNCGLNHHSNLCFGRPDGWNAWPCDHNYGATRVTPRYNNGCSGLSLHIFQICSAFANNKFVEASSYVHVHTIRVLPVFAGDFFDVVIVRVQLDRFFHVPLLTCLSRLLRVIFECPCRNPQLPVTSSSYFYNLVRANGRASVRLWCSIQILSECIYNCIHV